MLEIYCGCKVSLLACTMQAPKPGVLFLHQTCINSITITKAKLSCSDSKEKFPTCALSTSTTD